MLFGLGHVLGIVTLREQAAVHHGVQRLHAAVHHFREIRHCIDGRHIDVCLVNHLRGAASRNNLSSEFLVQSARELNHARFVGHRNQNAFNLGVSHVSSSVFLPLTFVYLISRIAHTPRHQREWAKKTRIGPPRHAAKPKCTLSTQIRVVFRARGFRIILLISLIDKLGNNGDGELSGRFCTKLQTNGAFDALPPFFSAAL